jgi:hypothetical protein
MMVNYKVQLTDPKLFIFFQIYKTTCPTICLRRHK